jgi:hypothetical protein
LKGILFDPRNEWPKIAAEPATVQSIYTTWVMILAAIGPLALMVRMQSVQLAVAEYVLSLIITFVLALIVDTLAPSFGGNKDFIESFKLTAYSYTVAWLAGILNVLSFGGVLRWLVLIYVIYTFYVGAPTLKKITPDKALPFTLVVVLCGFVLGTLASWVFAGMMSGPRMSGGIGMIR